MSDVLTRIQAALADHYRIERELGRGGMAAVYLTETELLIPSAARDLLQHLGSAPRRSE